VLGLVDIAVDDCLQQDEQHADEDREEGDGHVRLQVPLLQHSKNTTKSNGNARKEEARNVASDRPRT
jgi:hypothetical protein